MFVSSFEKRRELKSDQLEVSAANLSGGVAEESSAVEGIDIIFLGAATMVQRHLVVFVLHWLGSSIVCSTSISGAIQHSNSTAIN